MTPLAAIGIGNTTVSSGYTTAANWPPSWQVRVEQLTARFNPAMFAAQVAEGSSWFVSSVHRPSEQLLREYLREARPADRYFLLRHRDLDLAVDVRAPELVGMDRLLAAVAVNRLRHPDTPAVVVDAGTAITVDAVDRQGRFLGGAILTGVELTARSLATFTDLLPLVDTAFENARPEIIGKSTQEAIRAGLFFGGVGALRECLTRITESLGASPQLVPELFVTGGGARPLIDQIGIAHRFVPDLVLAGVVAAAQDMGEFPSDFDDTVAGG